MFTSVAIAFIGSHNLYISTFYYKTDCQEISGIECHIP